MAKSARSRSSSGNSWSIREPIASRQWHSGFLESRFQGVHFHSKGDPVLYVGNPKGVNRQQQKEVIDAVSSLNNLHNQQVDDPEIATRISQYELAFRMQASVPALVDLSDETQETLDLYGTRGADGSFASNCLLARRLVERGVRFVQLYHRGWVPATSSNFSMRFTEDCCAITTSGKDKGVLTRDDIMLVDLDGKPLVDLKPSAETLLHTQLYRHDDTINAVLHTHSIMATLVSQHSNSSAVTLENLELLKALDGIKTHKTQVTFPIFDNTQDIATLAKNVAGYMASTPQCHGYLIRGHGLYTWGKSMKDCIRHLEAIEFLLEYHWHTMRYQAKEES